MSEMAMFRQLTVRLRLATLAPKKSAKDIGLSIEGLQRLLREAAELWALGDPENPATKQVLDSMLKVMWNGQLAPRPPSRAYPEGF